MPFFPPSSQLPGALALARIREQNVAPVPRVGMIHLCLLLIDSLSTKSSSSATQGPKEERILEAGVSQPRSKP